MNNTSMQQKKETRVIQSMPVSLRNLGNDVNAESRIISGTGIIFNQPSQVLTDWKEGEGYVAFREIIMPEAVDNIDFTEVVTFYNHNENQLLGTGYAGTARYTVTPNGVDYECDAPNCETGNMVIEMIKRKDIRGSSFIFVANEAKDVWTKGEDGVWTRKIHEFMAVYEMGPVFGEAYRQTSANYRSYEKHVIEPEKREENKPPVKDDMVLSQIDCIEFQINN